MGLFTSKAAAENARLSASLGDAQYEIAEQRKQILALKATASAIERVAGLKEAAEQASDSILTLAAAVAAGNKQIASALGSLAIATERGARAKQAEVEYAKAQGTPNV